MQFSGYDNIFRAEVIKITLNTYDKIQDAERSLIDISSQDMENARARERIAIKKDKLVQDLCI